MLKTIAAFRFMKHLVFREENDSRCWNVYQGGSAWREAGVRISFRSSVADANLPWDSELALVQMYLLRVLCEDVHV